MVARGESKEGFSGEDHHDVIRRRTKAILEQEIRSAMHQGRDVQALVDASMGEEGMRTLARRAAGIADHNLATSEGAASALMGDGAREQHRAEAAAVMQLAKVLDREGLLSALRGGSRKNRTELIDIESLPSSMHVRAQADGPLRINVSAALVNTALRAMSYFAS